MSLMASQITSLTIVYSTVYSGADQRKHHSSESLAFVRGIHRGPVNSPHKWPVTRKMFPFDDVIMWTYWPHWTWMCFKGHQLNLLVLSDNRWLVIQGKVVIHRRLLYRCLLCVPGVSIYLHRFRQWINSSTTVVLRQPPICFIEGLLQEPVEEIDGICRCVYHV